MDSVTQAVFGAGIQGLMLGRQQGLRKALLAGAVLATLPDLDVLIDYGDPILGMINHRGFTHSVFILTAFAALLTLVIRRFWPSPHYSASRLFVTLWLVLITHPLLDALTSYGTQLLWPWKPTPTSWASLFIIDPFFTVPLLVAVLAGLVSGLGPRTFKLLKASMVWCCVYALASLGLKQWTEQRVVQEMAAQGIHAEHVFSTPQPFNILLWRVVVKTPEHDYVEAIRSVFDTEPSEWIRLPLNHDQAQAAPESEQLKGLRWFTGDWLRYDVIDDQLIVSDLRMGLATGFYTFRFKVAERSEPGGAWQSVTPTYWPTSRGTSELVRVLNRIVQQEPGLPLSDWESNMKKPLQQPAVRAF